VKREGVVVLVVKGWRHGGDVGGVMVMLRWMLVSGELGVTAGWAGAVCTRG